MSFFSNPRNIGPGPITGSPMTGLRHRVCVCVERVLDSCLKQCNNENTILHLGNFNPHNPSSPLKFLDAMCTRTDATVRDLQICRIEERPSFARIKCKINIPVQVNFNDANNVRSTAESEITVMEDVVLFVPSPSIFPFEVVANTSCNCPVGTYVGNNSFNVTACITIITKVVAKTDLLIPTYGFCPSPSCVEFEEEVCDRFFDLPLYPSGRG